jgi:multicomponent Na+:H+ antiporter subunit G
MTWPQIADAIAATCFVLGALLAMLAAIGMVKLPDLLSRMHAATKPQVLGLVLVLVGLGFRLRDPSVIGLLALIGVFQMLTTPVGNHMVGRASFRAGQLREERLVVNDLRDVSPTKDEPRGAP